MYCMHDPHMLRGFNILRAAHFPTLWEEVKLNCILITVCEQGKYVQEDVQLEFT